LVEILEALRHERPRGGSGRDRRELRDRRAGSGAGVGAGVGAGRRPGGRGSKMKVKKEQRGNSKKSRPGRRERSLKKGGKGRR
jgi:hypothetical protein